MYNKKKLILAAMLVLNKTKKNMCLVISPELIREVEARMNRNYLPPSLMQNSQGQLQQNTSAARRFGRACKLPTVQEVGEFVNDFVLTSIYFFLYYLIFIMVKSYWQKTLTCRE